MWYEVEDAGQSEARVLSMKIRVPANSPWFCGHFPGEPILPGIAQLGMVFDAISRSNDRKLTLRSVSRVRFKQAIRPDDRLKITAAPKRDDVDSYTFRIMHEEEVVCSGVMTFQGVQG
jgi:3-hydroxymyristoyl/3-hydroxydecanoyl-(acyl carrier protein) dehydratase